MFCPHCGKGNPGDAEFCMGCGKEILKKREEKPVIPEKTTSSVEKEKVERLDDIDLRKPVPLIFLLCTFITLIILLTYDSNPTKQALKYISKGNVLLNEGEFDEAIESFKKANSKDGDIDISSDLKKAYLGKAELQLKKGNLNEARTFAEKASSDSLLREIYLKQIDGYIKKGIRYVAIADNIRKVFSSCLNDTLRKACAEKLIQLSSSYLENTNSEEVLEYTQIAVELCPNDSKIIEKSEGIRQKYVDLLYKKAKKTFAQDRYEETKDYLKKILSFFPTSSKAKTLFNKVNKKQVFLLLRYTKKMKPISYKIDAFIRNIRAIRLNMALASLTQPSNPLSSAVWWQMCVDIRQECDWAEPELKDIIAYLDRISPPIEVRAPHEAIVTSIKELLCAVRENKEGVEEFIDVIAGGKIRSGEEFIEASVKLVQSGENISDKIDSADEITNAFKEVLKVSENLQEERIKYNLPNYGKK